MPFDEEDEPVIATKKGLKKISSQKSVFDTMPKKPSPEVLQQQAKRIEENEMAYKSRAAELAIKFTEMLADKTLPENRNIFQKELAKDLLMEMITLATEINNDPKMPEGEGSMGWITLLFKSCLRLRDRANVLDYRISKLESEMAKLKKLDPIDNR